MGEVSIASRATLAARLCEASTEMTIHSLEAPTDFGAGEVVRHPDFIHGPGRAMPDPPGDRPWMPIIH